MTCQNGYFTANVSTDHKKPRKVENDSCHFFKLLFIKSLSGNRFSVSGDEDIYFCLSGLSSPAVKLH